MTNAMLHRTRAFVEVGGVEVDIVTLDARADYPELEQRFLADGRMAAGSRILNLWDWLREHPLPGGSLHPQRHPLLLIDEERDASELGEPRMRDGRVLSRSRVGAEGETLQIDHYREDGTLLASDRRDVWKRGELGGRSVVLCDERGEPVRSWGRIWHLYTAWLDALIARRRTWMIVDSKAVANFILTYRRPNVVTLHLVHASHLVGQKRPMGTLRESRRPVFENLDGYDAVVLLTERQRHDVEIMLGRHDNLEVIPNARDLGDLDPASLDLERDPGHGVMLAALTKRKRVDHAIRAVSAAAEDLAGGAHRPDLDVFGDGELRGRFERMIAKLPDPDRVRLRGHDATAPRQLHHASYLILSSTSEGFPLVLVESMAGGCLPIAYDVPYGPADIIRDGRNGFLVPPGDIAGLTAAVERIATMPKPELDRMRLAAQRTAQRYTDERVTADWARAFGRALARKQLKRAGVTGYVTTARLARFVIVRGIRTRIERARRRRAAV